MEYILLNIFIVALLLLTNGFFVASEFALVNVRQTKMAQLAKDGNKKAELVCAEIEHLDKYIAAVQLGITIASIGLGWVGEATLAKILEPLFAWLPHFETKIAVHTIATGIAFAVITFLHVVMGELMPKSIALQFPERTALFIAEPMKHIADLFKPFIYLLNGFGNFLLKLIHISPATSSHSVHTPEEIGMIIDASFNEGILNETEKDMLQNIFEFSDKDAKQIMVPRPDMVAIPMDIEFDELEKIILNNQYTRYPVYEEDLDHVAGLLHVKDLYALTANKQDFNLKSMLREVKFFPETVSLDKLIREFKTNKVQMAIIVDEFGGTSGLITLEDILEEIVGEVQDEFDTDEEENITKINDDEYIANGIMRIDEFADYFNKEIPEEEDVETIAGIILKRLDRIAEVNDSVEFDDFILTVTELDGTRIVKIKVTKKPEEAVEEENTEEQKQEN
ncbi:MAG: hemolysin family protein [Candidatus Gastranaerophilales bacterium]|nr:hemolysin family protein [Candidatus Gastranaerophilales bacterium]